MTIANCSPIITSAIQTNGIAARSASVRRVGTPGANDEPSPSELYLWLAAYPASDASSYVIGDSFWIDGAGRVGGVGSAGYPPN